MTLHNPENLTPEQVGEGWRLLTRVEIMKPLPEDVEYWSRPCGSWKKRAFDGPACLENTYRICTATSPLVARLNAEIKRNKELLGIVNCIEAGAEWEVQWLPYWESPKQSLDYYIERGTPIRLKPAAPVAPLWDCAKDVPLKAWVRFKNSDDLYNLRNIEDRGIGFASFHVNWSELARIEYTLDGVTFHPCRKGGPR